MLREHLVRRSERGDRPRDPRYLRPTAPRERKPLDRAGQQLVGTGCSLWTGGRKTHARTDHARANTLGRLPRTTLELERTSPRNGDDEIETVEERPGELVAIVGKPLCGARAVRPRIAARAAWTEIHRSDQLETRRKAHAPGRAGNDELTVLERLPQRLQCGTLELRELVQQQHTEMRKARLTRTQTRPAADDRRRRRTVVRCAKRRVSDQRVIGIDEPRHRVDTRHFERLLLFERRQDPRQPAREHGLARSRRAAEQEVVPSGRRELERAAATLLATHGRQVERPVPRLSVADDEFGRLELAPQVGDRIGEM